MLKDKYKFKISHADAIELHQQIQKSFVLYASAKELEVQLPLVVLMGFQKRLVGSLLFPQSKINVYLKRTEALAFQILYMGDIIETTTETMLIAHTIDRTL